MPDAKVKFDKPINTSRMRVPLHITDSQSSNFGIEVQVNRHLTTRQEGLYPSGHGSESAGQEGQRQVYRGGAGPIEPGNQNYREVIPPGAIGTQEKYDIQLPAPQYVDTVAYKPDEQADPDLHGAMNALRESDTKSVPFCQYGDFQPRSAPLPRACQDEVGFGTGDKNMNTSIRLAADPLMTNDNSFKVFTERDPFRKDLYGDNVAGVLHNQPDVMIGKSQSPPNSATDTVVPQSQKPNLRNNVKLNPPTVTRPTTSMKGEPRGNQRARR